MMMGGYRVARESAGPRSHQGTLLTIGVQPISPLMLHVCTVAAAVAPDPELLLKKGSSP